MKKRVRIYKPTNKFQQGGTTTQYTPDQLMSLYLTALGETGDPAIAQNTLLQLNIDAEVIDQISSAVEEYTSAQQSAQNALTTGDMDSYDDIAAEQAAQEEASALAAAEEEARSARMQQMYSDYAEPDYSDDGFVSQDIIARMGGVPSKRTYVKNAVKLAKKQLGGGEDVNSKFVDSTDPDNKRKKSLSDFINSVQGEADAHLMKKDAEAMYSMLTTPIGGDQSYYQSPDMPEAQFGMNMRPGQQRRFNRRMNRMIGKMPIGYAGVPGGLMLPGMYTYPTMMGAMGNIGYMPSMGSDLGGVKMANIDVRRTGLFGRPKEYTITFAQDVVTQPQTKENVVKQEVKNKEEEIKDEAKAAEQGTVDKGVEEKKAEEALVDINDIQVVSGKSTPTRVTPQGTKPKGTTTTTKVNSATTKVKPVTKNTWSAPGDDLSGITYDEGMTWDERQALSEKLSSEEEKINRQKAQEAFENMQFKVPKSQQKSTKTSSYTPTPSNLQLKKINEAKRIQAIKRAQLLTKMQQTGGFTDTGSDLYKFLYGGNDGKLTGDPYFAKGGLYKFQGEGDSEVDSETNTKEETTPSYLTKEDLDSWWKGVQNQNQQGADPYAGYYNADAMGYGMPMIRTKQRGLPKDVATGQRYMGDIMNPEIAKIDVRKTFALGPYKGMPKKYSIDYMVDDWDPNGTAAAAEKNARGNRRQAGSERTEGRFAGNNFADRLLNSGNRPLTWLGSKLKPFETPADKTSGVPRDKNDEKYKRIYGHYPGEGPQQEPVSLAFQPRPNSELENEQYAPVPEFANMAGSTLPTRAVSPFDQFANRDIVPSQMYSSNKPFPEEPIALEPGQEGPMTEEDMLYAQEQDVDATEFERQRQQDLMGYGMGLLGVPSSGDIYNTELADENAMDRMNFDLERMRMQDPSYNQDIYNRPLNFDELQYTEQPSNISPVENTAQRNLGRRVENYKTTTRPTRSNATVSQERRKNLVAPVATENKPITPEVKKRSNISRSQAQQMQTFDELKNLKEKAFAGENPDVLRKSYANYKIDPRIERSMNRMSPTQRLGYLKAIKSSDINLYNALLLKYGKTGGMMAYGGSLYKASTGFNNDLDEDTPMNMDPRFSPNVDTGITDLENIDWRTEYPIPEDAPKNAATESEVIDWSPEAKQRAKEERAKLGIEEFEEDPQIEYGRKRISVDYSNKRPKMSGDERRQWLDIANATGNFILDKIPERGSRERQAKMAQGYLSDNIYGSTGQYDRGWVDTNSGLDIPDTYGQRQYAKYGGFYEEGGETWMSEEDVRRFLEEGGELEFV